MPKTLVKVENVNQSKKTTVQSPGEELLVHNSSVKLLGSDLLDSFITRCRAMKEPRVLELGSRHLPNLPSTRRDTWVPNASEYLGTDIESGPDVDIKADVHQLSKVVGEEQFDAIISCSTFEHFKYPHLAAHEIMKTLKVGGILFIQTHHTFPLHNYPYDYFRFSREALAGLFGTKMEFQVIRTDYEYPTQILNFRKPSLCRLRAYLNVRLFGEKVGKTPENYIFELE
jgi:SAM-dependent methyltransferase